MTIEAREGHVKWISNINFNSSSFWKARKEAFEIEDTGEMLNGSMAVDLVKKHCKLVKNEDGIAARAMFLIENSGAGENASDYWDSIWESI